jgi:TonB family protein
MTLPLFLLSLLFVPTVDGIQQPTTPAPVNQAAPALAPISSPEIDALAAKLVPEIAKRHFGRVAVFGASGPGDQPTQLGKAIGDALSDSLSRRAQEFTVVDRDKMREALKTLRVSETALLNEYLADWICPKIQAGGAVILQIKGLEGNAAILKADVFDWTELSKKPAYSAQETLTLGRDLIGASRMPLNSDQSLPILGERGNSGGGTGITNPVCVDCPPADLSTEAQKMRLSGEAYLAATILRDGKLTEISVVKAAGHGLDARAVEALLRWQLKPALDQGARPIEKRMSIKIEFLDYGGSGYPLRAGSSIPQVVPVCISCPRPDYSEEGRKNRIQGDVWLEVVITPEGKVSDPKIIKSLGYGLDEMAVKDVEKWRFKPPTSPNGLPIRLMATIQVQFKLN